MFWLRCVTVLLSFMRSACGFWCCWCVLGCWLVSSAGSCVANGLGASFLSGGCWPASSSLPFLFFRPLVSRLRCCRFVTDALRVRPGLPFPVRLLPKPAGARSGCGGGDPADSTTLAGRLDSSLSILFAGNTPMKKEERETWKMVNCETTPKTR